MEHEEWVRRISAGRAATEAPNSIDMETFSQVLLTLKAEKGLTWRQMANMAGRSMSHMSSLGTGTKKKCIHKDTAEDIMRRLSGENLPPTSWQISQYNKKMQKLHRETRAETLKQRKVDERNAKFQALSLRLEAS